MTIIEFVLTRRRISSRHRSRLFFAGNFKCVFGKKSHYTVYSLSVTQWLQWAHYGLTALTGCSLRPTMSHGLLATYGYGKSNFTLPNAINTGELSILLLRTYRLTSYFQVSSRGSHRLHVRERPLLPSILPTLLHDSKNAVPALDHHILSLG
jgi:hypothetical protein